MAAVTPARLLRELEGMTHDGRVRRMIALGREAATDADTARTIDVLSRGDVYRRLLALYSAFGSRDSERVRRAFDDPSRMIFGLAIVIGPRLCADDQLLAVLDRVPSDARRPILHRLREANRLSVIDSFLLRLRERDDRHVEALLPHGSEATVEDQWRAYEASAKISTWTRLARLHPRVAAASLLRLAAAAEQPDLRLLQAANAALAVLAEREPDAALSIVRVLARTIPLGQIGLGSLPRRRPREVVDLALGSQDTARLRLDAIAATLDIARLRALFERGMLTLASRWFRRVRPDLRAAVYQASGLDRRAAPVDLTLLALLPRPVREAEARRLMALPSHAARPAARLPYAVFLPWAEARATLDPWLGDPEADLRLVALTALIGVARFWREQTADVLAFVIARRREQDPVRQAMLSALAALPPKLWQASNLDSLAQVVRHALNAADLSEGTAANVERLLLRILPMHPVWALEQLTVVTRERGRLSTDALGMLLTDAQVRNLTRVLLPVLRSWETREREGYLIRAALHFGTRLSAADQLLDILERLVRESRTHWVAEWALRLIAQHRRERLADLVPILVREDKSWITQATVSGYLHRCRQDLLTPFLGERAYRGRFSTGRTRFVLPFTSGFGRWTASQQERFGRTLTAAVRDAERDTPTVIRWINQLVALPAAPADDLLALTADSREAVRDAALRAAARLDAGQGVPVLLATLDDDRASVGIYALRRALLAMPAERALAILRAAPLDKITVAKEVVRLIGELGSTEALSVLLAFDRDDLHRDVRVAMLRALWEHTEQPEVWPVFDRAATSPDPVLARTVARIPAEGMPPESRRRLLALLALLLAHPDVTVRVAALGRCAQLPVIDHDRALLPRLRESLASPVQDERTVAAGAIFATYTGNDAVIAGEAVERVRSDRRALQSAISALTGLAWSGRGSMLPTIRAVLAVLRSDPHTATLRAELAVEALPPDDLAELLGNIAAAGELHAEAMMAAVARLYRLRGTRSDEAARLESLLAGDLDERLRRVALAALVVSAGGPTGWDEERLRRLRVYRTDPSLLVSSAAQFTLPPEEVEAHDEPR